jgi:hypothetical protein
MEEDKKLEKIILGVSLVLFLTSLTQKCYCTTSSCGDSIMVLFLGWFSALTGGAGITWLANPLLVAAWLSLKKRLKISMFLSVLATLVALMFMLFTSITDNEGGISHQIIAYKPGYWLWVASCSTMLAGTFVLQLRFNNQRLAGKRAA